MQAKCFSYVVTFSLYKSGEVDIILLYKFLRNLRGGKDTKTPHLSEIKVHMYLWKYEAKGEETVTNFSGCSPHIMWDQRSHEHACAWRESQLTWSDLACGLEGSAEDEPEQTDRSPGRTVSSPPPRTPGSPLFQQRPSSAAITMGISDTAVLQHKKLLQWVGPQVSPALPAVPGPLKSLLTPWCSAFCPSYGPALTPTWPWENHSLD